MKGYRTFYGDSEFTIYRENEVFLGKIQMKLLKQIQLDGSINASAKNLKMSYQHAWHLINKVNQLSPLPVVIRQKGGRDGGGCLISPFGLRIMAAYEQNLKILLQKTEEINFELEKCFF